MCSTRVEKAFLDAEEARRAKKAPGTPSPTSNARSSRMRGRAETVDELELQLRKQETDDDLLSAVEAAAELAEKKSVSQTPPSKGSPSMLF